ncbi:MAG: AAA family ATPase [Spirochaetaceae bacterium]|nr:AAA family ATPase [Spirochaetaceae bacterium]
MRIAISGKSGCGNTTVTTLLAETLGYTKINFTFRNLAAEKGFDFWDFCKMAESDSAYDKELDIRQVQMAMAVKNCVLGSRLAIWMLKDAEVKVYLNASIKERAKRIFKREKGDFQTRLKQTKVRDDCDTNRYKAIYNIDNNDTSIANIVIDTEGKTPENIVQIIIDYIKEMNI